MLGIVLLRLVVRLGAILFWFLGIGWEELGQK